MLEKLLGKLKSTPLSKLVKFSLIFAVTGTCCLFISEIISSFLARVLEIDGHIVIDVVIVTITYQILLVIFCFLCGELGYVMGKYRKLKAFLQRSNR